jgi:hypothetical protein
MHPRPLALYVGPAILLGAMIIAGVVALGLVASHGFTQTLQQIRYVGSHDKLSLASQHDGYQRYPHIYSAVEAPLPRDDSKQTPQRGPFEDDLIHAPVRSS